jgi:transposase InsO family protein
MQVGLMNVNRSLFRARHRATWGWGRFDKRDFIYIAKSDDYQWTLCRTGSLASAPSGCRVFWISISPEWFRDLREARAIIGSWRQFYNQRRPHSALGYRHLPGFENNAVILRCISPSKRLQIPYPGHPTQQPSRNYAEYRLSESLVTKKLIRHSLERSRPSLQ